MSGNTTTSNNFTGLYGASAGTVVPTTPYGNANVVSLLAVGSDGANTVGNILATGNVTANYFLGNGSQLTGIAASSYGNANVATFLAAFGANTISTTGNITGGYILGNGSQLTGLPATYGNANVVANLAALGSNPVSTTGNVTADYFIGNGSLLTAIPAGNITGQVANALVAGTVYTPAQPNITSVGTLTSLSSSGNITGANLAITTDAVIQGNLTVNGNTTFINSNTVTINDKFINVANNAATAAAANGGGLGVGPVGGEYATLTYDSTANAWNTSIAVSVTGNVSGTNFVGDGQYLSNITGANVTGTVANATSAITAGTVTANAQANITSVGVLTSLSVSGNTQSGNLLTVGQVSATGNVTGNFFIGNGSQLTGIAASYGNANVVANLAALGTNPVSTTGNITAGYFLGNGSQLTGITGGNATPGGAANSIQFKSGNTFAGISDAFHYTGNGITEISKVQFSSTSSGGGSGEVFVPGTVGYVSVVGNIIGGNIATAGVITATSNITGGNIVTAGVVTATGNITGGNIVTAGVVTATGNITGGNILTVGQVSATGNISGNFFIGNGSQLTGIAGGYGDANVATFMAAFGSNTISTTGTITSGNITATNLVTTGASGNVSNVNYFLGNVVSATANITGGNILTAGLISATANITGGNILTAGLISATANITGGNILTAGLISATGNITGNYFVGNGSALTGISAAPGGANTQIQFNDASAFGGNANLTFNNSTGNVNLGNLIVTTSNALNFINTVTPSAGAPAANVTTLNSSQIIIGNGWAGNLNLNNQQGAISFRGSKFLYWDTVNITDSGGPRVNGLGSNPMIQLQGNVSNTNTRLSAFSGTLNIGGTANNFQYTTNSTFAAVGVNTGITVGQSAANPAVGNTIVTNMTGVASNMTVNGASNVGNSIGLYTAMSAQSAAYVQTAAGLVVQFSNNPTVAPANLYGVYMNGNTSAGIFAGLTNSNGMRKADNYYFLRNDDTLAQNKLGSLRLFHEYQYDNSSSAGTLTVDKNNGQVQSVVLTEAITTVTLSNFVTSASDGTTTDFQTDTVTLILRQGATPYAVTMPTGSAYRYAAGSTSVGATANTTTMISVTANYDSISSADQYLITISPEFI